MRKVKVFRKMSLYLSILSERKFMQIVEIGMTLSGEETYVKIVGNGNLGWFNRTIEWKIGTGDKIHVLSDTREWWDEI